MSRNLGFYVLALRIAVAWWLFLIAASLLAGGTLALFGRLLFDPGYASDLGLALPFFGGLFFFPPAAVFIGLYSAYRQKKALDAVEGAPALLSIGSERSINLDLPAEQALKIAESAMGSVHKGAALHIHASGIAVRVTDLAKSAVLFPGLYQDNLVLAVSAEGDDRSVLKISCSPLHLWLFGILLVDAGRCARHVRAVETAIQDRVRAQSLVIDALRKRETSRARHSEAELSMLRAHIEPHFMFNTLAHVKASLGSEGDVAERMLDALIEFLRSNSQSFSRPEAALSDEIRMVESYLKIVALRLGEKLRYDIRCPSELFGCHVPSATILVLVENAVKHGIERTADGGAISVVCEMRDGLLSIVCQNDGPRFEIVGGKPGGLSNLQDRLRLMHGSSFSMEIENSVHGGVRATLSLPCLREAA